MSPSRRQFIQRCAIVIGGAATRYAHTKPQVSAAVDGTLVNWAGNYRYSTDHLSMPPHCRRCRSSLESTSRFKVLGTRHCFNGIADSADDLLSLREMEPSSSWIAASRKVTSNRE